MIRSLSILSCLLIIYSLLEIGVSSEDTTDDVISSHDDSSTQIGVQGYPNVASRNRVPTTTVDAISSQDGRTKLGIQVERDEGYPNVKSRDRIAILTNPSGVFPDNLEHIVDVLNREFPGVIKLVLAPEHGTLSTSSKPSNTERLQQRQRQDFEVINKRRAVILTRMSIL